ncbi:hypothetical protein ACFWU3_26600, partial [Streptomyces sp. NPDC058685]|uniref:hypothetical protein n=1 Tax=Streptomyces sp. NPDC058685 TaxID=3346598 RepID=UPI00365E5C85
GTSVDAVVPPEGWVSFPWVPAAKQRWGHELRFSARPGAKPRYDDRTAHPADEARREGEQR